jgi:hypothetical protein
MSSYKCKYEISCKLFNLSLRVVNLLADIMAFFLLFLSHLLLCRAQSPGAETSTSNAPIGTNTNKFTTTRAAEGSSALPSTTTFPQEVFCTSNATCPSGEYCFDYPASSWLVPCSPERGEYCYDARTSSEAKPGVERTGVCFGKKCIANSGDPQHRCGGLRTCVHRIIEAGLLSPSAPRMMAKTGRCLDQRTCIPNFFANCPNGWTCIRGQDPGLGLGLFCAPESFSWDFGKRSIPALS